MLTSSPRWHRSIFALTVFFHLLHSCLLTLPPYFPPSISRHFDRDPSPKQQPPRSGPNLITTTTGLGEISDSIVSNVLFNFFAFSCAVSIFLSYVGPKWKACFYFCAPTNPTLDKIGIVSSAWLYAKVQFAWEMAKGNGKISCDMLLMLPSFTLKKKSNVHDWNL